MKFNQLTTLKIAAAKKRGYYADGAGLYLQVSKHGSRNWIFRYTVGGRTRDMGLGSAKIIRLKGARELARECREKILRGEDPIEVRRQKRDRGRAMAAENMLFRDAAERFIALHSPTWKNEKHRRQWSSTLKAYAYRSLGTRPISAIDGAIITEALSPIWMTKMETAARVKQRIERIVQWVKDGMPLPQQGASKRVQHHPAIAFTELPAFMAELREHDGMSARALEFTILTAARTTETINATWDEIDFDNAVWSIPAGRMKAGKAHEVPLSKRAVEVLRSLPRDGEYILRGRKPDPASVFEREMRSYLLVAYELLWGASSERAAAAEVEKKDGIDSGTARNAHMRLKARFGKDNPILEWLRANYGPQTKA
jgi:integrase